MWQFAEAVRGLADGCRELGIPVTGGNVSFYNQTGDDARSNPTPVVGVLGVIDDVTPARPDGLRTATATLIFLLGETRDEFGGSEWAHVVHGHLGGRPPAVDLAAERALADGPRRRPRATGMLDRAHDLSDGGLAQALVESCLRGGVGARIALPAGVDPFVALFSESAGRAVVVGRRGIEERVHRTLCRRAACRSPAHRRRRHARDQPGRSTGSSRSRCASCARPGRRPAAGPLRAV